MTSGSWLSLGLFHLIFAWRGGKNRHCAGMTQQTEPQQDATPQAKAGAMIIPVTLFEQNCTLIWCTASKKAVVIDPGGDVPKILRAIEQSDVKVEKIWLTHGHIDHVGGAAELRDELKVPIEGPHIADKYLLDNVVSSGARFGMTGVRDFAPDRWLNEGDTVATGALSFGILHSPGHPPCPRHRAGQLGVRQQEIVFRSCRRRAVPRLGRRYCPPGRQPRDADQLD